LRVGVSTRHDPSWPLHRLRLEGRLLELRSGDLAFCPEDAAALLSTGASSPSPTWMCLSSGTEGSG
jgi:LuxR family transcriptional regulator, maltose regulon positive regulatory protein